MDRKSLPRIELLALQVLADTLGLALVPAVGMGRRYFRAFLSGEKSLTGFNDNAHSNARLSMLTLGCNLISPHWKDGDLIIAEIRDYVHTQKMEETR